MAAFGSILHRTLCLFVLAGALSRAHADQASAAAGSLPLSPLASREFNFDPPLAGPSPCTRAAPAIAMGESVSLMVWTHGKGPSTDPALYAARVAPDGTLLDPYGILISRSAGEQTVSAVAANPGGFLVVWSAPHGASVTDWDILGARIQTDGTLLDTAPLAVCTLGGSIQTSPAVAANGSNYLVTWRDSRSTGIYGTVVLPDGSIQNTNGFPICTAANDQFTPAVAALGTNYLAVWQDYRKATSAKYISGIYGARISGSGVLMDTNGIAISTNTTSLYHPTVAGGPTNFLVVWEGYDRSGNDIFGARLSPDGTVLDPTGLLISHGDNLQTSPVVAGTRDGFLVAWQDYRGSGTNAFTSAVYGTLVGGDGSVLDADGVPISSGSGNQVKPALAARGAQALVLWQDFRNNPSSVLSDIYGARLDFNSNALVDPSFDAIQTVNAQWHPGAAACGTNLLVVWADDRAVGSAASRIYGTRVTPGGTLVESAALPIATGPNRQTDPAAASNGASTLVVWSQWPASNSVDQVADVYGALVNEAGQVSPTGGIPISTSKDDQTLPAVTPFGTGWLVVWQDARNRGSSGAHQDIYGTRVSRDGTVLDPDGIAISTNSASHLTPAVAANGSQALVIWTESRGTLTDIYGVRVDGNGQWIDTNSFPICRAANLQLSPAVAANGTGYLVTWVDRRNVLLGSDIYAAAVGLDGQVQPTDGFVVRSALGNQSAPAVTAQGSDYLVIWQEPLASRSEFSDLLGVWVSGDGRSVGSTPMVIAEEALDHARPVAAVGPTGPILVVSQALVNSSARVTGSIFDLQALPRLRWTPSPGEDRASVQLRGAPARRYSIERSVDLRQWALAATLTLTNEAVLWTDPAATNRPQLFYRATLQP